MNDTTNNIPAYPTLRSNSEAIDVYQAGGMTLLDHFAGLAMPALLRNTTAYYPNSAMHLPDTEALSKDSYRIAAAMLEARKRYIQ